MSTADTQGARTAATFDGYPLAGVAADLWEVAAAELKGNVTMADGSVREQRLAPLPGLPQVTWRHTFSLGWAHVGKLQRAIEARLAFPGAHRICFWKHMTLGYLGDGTTAEMSLPAGWRLALHVLTPPDGLPAARYEPEVRIGLDSLDLVPVSHVAPELYASDVTPEGEVWFERTTGDTTGRFRFGLAPGVDERVVVSVVPEIRCLTAGDSESRQYRDPHREPRRIVLVEA